jgi:signal transduction histidine kinase
MGQLLSNLLGNALLYGSPWAEVTVRLWSTPAAVCFSVHNFGAAIPPAERERIFQPLQRGAQHARRIASREPSGLGLGLYICREIVLAHGGELAMDSTPDAGTTFSVSLPRHAAA